MPEEQEGAAHPLQVFESSRNVLDVSGRRSSGAIICKTPVTTPRQDPVTMRQPARLSRISGTAVVGFRSNVTEVDAREGFERRVDSQEGQATQIPMERHSPTDNTKN